MILMNLLFVFLIFFLLIVSIMSKIVSIIGKMKSIMGGMSEN